MSAFPGGGIVRAGTKLLNPAIRFGLSGKVFTKRPTVTDRLKEQLFERPGKRKSQTALRSAQEELAGSQTGFDHVTKIRNAQRGLLKRLRQINRQLGNPNLSEIERGALQQELSEASKILDFSEQFVPR